MSTNYYTDTQEDTIDSEELALYNLIMQYRAANGLGSIALSKALTIVASRHTLDTVYNVGSYAGHSWSDAPYDGADSSTYANMWQAPQRLNTGYGGYGFEITTGYSGSSVQNFDMTAKGALENWQSSAPHNNVILNKDIWATTDWNAIGVAIHKGIAHVWFGREADPTGAPLVEGQSPTDGNDVIYFTPGSTVVNLGAGTDTLVVSEARGGRVVTQSGNDMQVTIGGQTITLQGVERLQFIDGTLAFDTGVGETAGQAYRLYQAAFDRTPDGSGLGYWIHALDAGQGNLNWVAGNFINSNEFKATYGTSATVSNTDFVNLLYANVLNRQSDGAGFDYWVSTLNNGTSREQVLVSFSESAENQSNVAAAISDGIWYA